MLSFEEDFITTIITKTMEVKTELFALTMRREL